MLKYRLFIPVLLGICAVTSCKRKSQGPVINYANKVINLGSISFKKEYEGQIIIRNIGDETLTLLGATADCSCTVPEDIKNTQIKAQDSGIVRFKLTPGVDGYMQQNIYLDNNSENESRALFLIRANVKLVE